MFYYSLFSLSFTILLIIPVPFFFFFFFFFFFYNFSEENKDDDDSDRGGVFGSKEVTFFQENPKVCLLLFLCLFVRQLTQKKNNRKEKGNLRGA